MIHIGYPRTSSLADEVDSLYEAESARLWEELNSEADIDLYPAIEHMDDALAFINKAISELNSGVESAKGTPYEYRIGSLVMELEDVYSHIEDEIAYIKKREGV